MRKWILSMMMVVVLSAGGCNYLWSTGKDDANNIVAITNYADQLNAQATVYKNAIDATTAYLAAGGVLDANGVAKYLHYKEELERIQVAATAIAASIRSGDYANDDPRLITGLKIATKTNEAIPGPWQVPIAGALTLALSIATYLWRKKVAEATLATSTLQNVVTGVQVSSEAAYNEVTSNIHNDVEQKALVTSLKPDIPAGFEITKTITPAL